MHAYSQDLRDRVLGALARGERPSAIARRYEVSRMWVALPPEISHMTVWSPITPERKLDDEEAIYRGANHWLPA